MALAAYVKKVQVSVNGTTNWLDVPCEEPSLNFGGEIIDATTLSGVGSTGWRTRILGLHDWSISCDSNYTNGQAALAAIRTAKLNRSALFARYLPTGVIAEGFAGEVVVENFDLSGGVAGKETVAITLQAKGALAAAS
jgi:predicted secreted protein